MSLVNFRFNLYMMLVKLLPFEIKVPKTEITETEIKGKIRFQPNFASSFIGVFKVELPEIKLVSKYDHLVCHQVQWQILILHVGKVIKGKW